MRSRRWQAAAVTMASNGSRQQAAQIPDAGQGGQCFQAGAGRRGGRRSRFRAVRRGADGVVPLAVRAVPGDEAFF